MHMWQGVREGSVGGGLLSVDRSGNKLGRMHSVFIALI